jgi:hypothetical protein
MAHFRRFVSERGAQLGFRSRAMENSQRRTDSKPSAIAVPMIVLRLDRDSAQNAAALDGNVR